MELLVKGMTCDGCVRSVTRAVQRAQPGAMVAVDLKSGAVRIDGAADAKAVRQAIEKAGYEVAGAAA
jgi:copper chaperone